MKTKPLGCLLACVTVVLLILILKDASAHVAYTVGTVLVIVAIVDSNYGHVIPEALKWLAQIIDDLCRFFNGK